MGMVVPLGLVTAVTMHVDYTGIGVRFKWDEMRAIEDVALVVGELETISLDFGVGLVEDLWTEVLLGVRCAGWTDCVFPELLVGEVKFRI
jgi:hypothetical protein